MHWGSRETGRAGSDRGSAAAAEARGGAAARGRVRGGTRRRWRSTRRTERDERSHGPAPTHDSLRRNDETAGYARALCDAASWLPPTREISRRRRGEQTRHASPSNSDEVKKDLDFLPAFYGLIVLQAYAS